jgi:nucleoside-diphosphate-sugar epimerase
MKRATRRVAMKISILGGGGFLGRKIAERLARDGRLGDRPITGLTLFDLAAPPKPEAPFPVHSLIFSRCRRKPFPPARNWCFTSPPL